MTTPTPDRLRDALTNGRYLEPLADRFAERIFETQFQGDELIDAIEELQARWGFLSEDDPDKDIWVHTLIIDEVWNRIMAKILMKMQETRRFDNSCPST